MDYRKYYKKELGVNLTSDFHVHHIDLDKTNNDISNLVALPRVLHGKYHAAIMRIKPVSQYLPLCTKLSYQGEQCNSYAIYCMEQFQNVYSECVKWVMFRDYHLGLTANMFGLSYEVNDG